MFHWHCTGDFRDKSCPAKHGLPGRWRGRRQFGKFLRINASRIVIRDLHN